MTFSLHLGEPIPKDTPIFERTGVRAIIQQNGRLLLMKSNRGDYKFPGGGAEAGEGDHAALIREIHEETGFVDFTIGVKRGSVIQTKPDQYRPGQWYKLTSPYYEVQLHSLERRPVQLTEDEQEQGFQAVWITPQQAIEVNKRIPIDPNLNGYIERENWVLQEVKDRLMTVKKENTMLTTKQLTDIETLQKEVEAFDGLELKLNWEMLRERESDQLDFFHYEDDHLVAFLGLYLFGSSVEVTGMVKPSARRKGHFTTLFIDAMEAVQQLGCKKILLNAPASSEGAKRFLEKQGAVYKFSENQMQWKPKPLNVSGGFTLRHAEAADFEMRIRLDIEGFGLTREDAIATESRITSETDTDLLMIDVDNQTVGKVRVKREDGQAWIYGFTILPEHRGKGIGRKVLEHLVKQQSEAGHSVHLEVEVTNAHALGLYESVGFEVKHAQDYYEL